jgi:lysophospholipase L1-like esterase
VTVKRLLRLLPFTLSLLAAAPAPPQACPAGEAPKLPVPHVRAALQAGQEIVIVAIGSSSTQSWMASDPAHSYPAEGPARRRAPLPRAHVAVINRGIGGQDAPEELSRMDSDVLAVRPQLVIWQVGANGALRKDAPELFRQLVHTGIRRLQAANKDIILMDNQRSPAILAAPDHLAMDQALADLADETNVELFSRSKLMDMWRDEGVPYAAFVSSDNLHLNDYGYRCVADALAAAIVAGIKG